MLNTPPKMLFFTLHYQRRWGSALSSPKLKSFRMFYDRKIAVRGLKSLHTSGINSLDILWLKRMRSDSMEVRAAGAHAQGRGWRQTRQL